MENLKDTFDDMLHIFLFIQHFYSYCEDEKRNEKIQTIRFNQSKPYIMLFKNICEHPDMVCVKFLRDELFKEHSYSQEDNNNVSVL